MGRRYEKRDRLTSFRSDKVSDVLLSSLGSIDINYEKYDEQQIADTINKQLDKADARIQKNWGEG